ncbi:MAG: exodeoxyribonuclease VII large subunit, partial [Oscillospiraceae bacterium]|nr:exodeoxyribonuclease VII large subunit [Oscillospiraceae bacterium]
MEDDPLLTGLLVRGEVSNYKCYPSGHHYFSLKDEQGSLRCVMFRGEAARLRFRPANGMRVVAFGRVSVFPRDGQYQLYCAELMQDGRGALDEAFEKLRRRLEAEGLFDEAGKQPLPRYPRKIALVTSPAGAAVRDMVRVLGARWPLAQVLVVPVRVQGAEAAGE